MDRCELHASPTLELAGVTDDSRAAEEGFLFAAVPGTAADGAAYVADALARGAACVLCERAPQENIPYVLVPDVRAALALVAAQWYGRPAERLTIVGVTGTNGKTTTTYLIKQLLEETLGAKVGLIGTNQNLIGAQSLPASRTTPGPLALHALFADMAAAGCTHAVMEVSSHALAQRRVAGIRFAVGVFTNLTQDHLDYHRTMEAYCDAKALLFSQCDRAAVNGDDPWHTRVLARSRCPVQTFGQGLDNDLVGWRAHYAADRVDFTVSDDTEHVPATVGIPGAFSLYNALAALSAVRALGVPLADAARALAHCRGVRGRCEVVPADAPFTVLIDYAHTPDGLRNILTAVCGFAQERVLVVFGCGGERDQTKRARMGRIAAALADLVVLTSDNPRSENPYRILHDILGGMDGSPTPFAVLEDRRAAIAYALSHARPGDVVVLAGKGHETVQLSGGTARAFDERAVVREELERMKNAGFPAEEETYEDHACLHPELRGHGGRGEAADPLAAAAQGRAGDP